MVQYCLMLGTSYKKFSCWLLINHSSKFSSRTIAKLMLVCRLNFTCLKNSFPFKIIVHKFNKDIKTQKDSSLHTNLVHDVNHFKILIHSPH